MGMYTPFDVAQARHNGMLTGMGRNAAPMIAYLPDQGTLNPREQPEGEGHREYFTTGPGSAEDLAHVNFGDFGGLPARPTAEQIWQLR